MSRAEAIDPSTGKDRLAALVRDYPADVLANIALELHRLADPGWDVPRRAVRQLRINRYADKYMGIAFGDGETSCDRISSQPTDGTADIANIGYVVFGHDRHVTFTKHGNSTDHGDGSAYTEQGYAISFVPVLTFNQINVSSVHYLCTGAGMSLDNESRFTAHNIDSLVYVPLGAKQGL